MKLIKLGSLILFITFWACQPEKNLLVIESPSGNLKVTVTNEEGKVFFQLFSKTGTSETLVIKPSPLGLVLSDVNFAENLSLESRSKIKTLTENYYMVSGKQKELSWTANETTLLFKNQDGKQIEMVFRLFDEGLAFRYVFPGHSEEKVTVKSEVTGFAVSEGADGWMSAYQAATSWGNPGYEDDYLAVKAGTGSPEKVGWAFPLLFNDGGNWIFISETGLDENYCATHINQDCAGGLYTISLPEANERQGDGEIHPKSKLPWTMPWRFIVVGQSLNFVAESSMVHHLAEPSKVEDISWIKPGRASWEWWSSKSGRTVKNLNHFVDLAAEMGWEYSLVDAGWEKMSDGTIEEVVAHAKTKNVGLFFWYNSGGRRDSSAHNEDFILFNHDTRDREMVRIAAMGVKGIKVDFFATDKQMAIELYLKILRDAAKHRLLVNFHGCTLPRGWSRTYPNLLAMEAVRGAECYRFAAGYPEIAANYNTIAAVTRGVVGPTDFTPATFSNQRYPRKTTSAHELALTLVYETGLLHLADTPETYRSQPMEIINFLKEVPVTWDESRVLAAIPGELFVVARRNGEKWYVAGINGKNEPQEVQIELPFSLNSPLLFADGKTISEFSIQTLKGNINTFSVKMMSDGGFVLY
jgi:alpha-glucosidase